MALHLLYFILITITTTITNYSCGELFLHMPLTINPVVQDAITQRDSIVTHFYNSNPEYYSRVTPAHFVVTLNDSLTFVTSKSINGAVVLGLAAKTAGLTVSQLGNIDVYNKWSVSVSLAEIKSVLKNNEQHLLPLSVNITIVALQNLGLRALQKRYNVSLPSKITEPLHSSSAMTLPAIVEDWIRVVRFITKINVESLAARYKVTVTTLAHSLKMTTDELYHVTLNELDIVLATKFTFRDGSFEVLVTTTRSMTEQTTLKSSTLIQSSTGTKLPTQSTLTRKTIIIPTGKKSTINLRTTIVSDPTKGSSSGETGTVNMALYIGAPVGLLLFIVAISTWCFRRKRRRSENNNQEKHKTNDIKMNNFWIEKNEYDLSANREDMPQGAHIFHARSLNGIDSRFKGLKYAPTSSTFALNTPLKLTNSRFDFENDTRREIFV